jgi:hypothetical protein
LLAQVFAGPVWASPAAAIFDFVTYAYALSQDCCLCQQIYLLGIRDEYPKRPRKALSSKEFRPSSLDDRAECYAAKLLPT